MADQSKVLETMASQLATVAAGLEALRVQGAAQTAANAETADKLAEMQQRISQHDALLTGDPLCFPQLHQWRARRTGRSEFHMEAQAPHSQCPGRSARQ